MISHPFDTAVAHTKLNARRDAVGESDDLSALRNEGELGHDLRSARGTLKQVHPSQWQHFLDALGPDATVQRQPLGLWLPMQARITDMGNMQVHSKADIPRVPTAHKATWVRISDPSRSLPGDGFAFLSVWTHLVPTICVSGGREAICSGVSFSTAPSFSQTTTPLPWTDQKTLCPWISSP